VQITVESELTLGDAAAEQWPIDGGGPGQGQLSGLFDATTREPASHVANVLGGYQAYAEERLAPGASTAPHKNYAGTYANGKFEKTKAANLNDLTEEERQAVLADLHADRQRRAHELKQKKKQHAAKTQQARKSPGARRQARANSQAQTTEEFGLQRSHEMQARSMRKDEDSKENRKKKAEAMASVLAKAALQQEMNDKFQADQASKRDRRSQIAEKRKGFIQQQMALKGGYQPAVTQEAFPNSRLLHRHIHHHMHYHSEGSGDESGPRPHRTNDSTETQLPPLASDGFARGGIHPGLRRIQSDTVVGAAGPSGHPFGALVHSPSAGQVLPQIAVRPPLGRGQAAQSQGAGGFHQAIGSNGDAGPVPRMRASIP